jgi:hypothetical protein
MGDSADRRAAERIPVNSGTACAFVGKVVGDVGPVKIRDVSLDGIGLVLLRPLQVGDFLAIVLENAARGFAKTIMVRVAHVTTVPGGFLIGGAFVEPLTYQEFTGLVM